MASEILSVPEDNLEEVIKIIRKGLETTEDISKDVLRNLSTWCDEEEEYLKELKE